MSTLQFETSVDLEDYCICVSLFGVWLETAVAEKLFALFGILLHFLDFSCGFAVVATMVVLKMVPMLVTDS